MRRKTRDIFSSACSLSKWQWTELGQPETGSIKLYLSLPHGHRDSELGSSAAASLCTLSRSQTEVEQLGLKLVPTWDSGIIDGSLSCYSTRPAPIINITGSSGFKLRQLRNTLLDILCIKNFRKPSF